MHVTYSQYSSAPEICLVQRARTRIS